MSLASFHPAVAHWFRSAFDAPTPAQAAAWAAIAQGRHTLVAAPTGSGKTLAAFLHALDALVREALAGTLGNATRVVYVSPLKALSNDVHLNLERPLTGIAAELERMGLPPVEIRSAVRTGDTPQAERAKWRKRPPHIIVTTPESLYILLGSESGRAMLAGVNSVIGSLGMAVSEAVEVAAQNPDTRYALGSVLNHVVLHQSVIGQEAVEQLAAVEPDGADVVFGCAGGGSNLGGLSFPFLREKLHGRSNPRVVAAEPAACPSITQGEYRYDHGDVAGLTPLLKMHTLGMDFVPDPIHAGGLRYHGMAPALSHTVELGLVEGVAISQHDAFSAGVQFARTQGIVPAPESTHAIAACAAHVADNDTEQVVVIGLSGHGQLDLPAYAEFLEGSF